MTRATSDEPRPRGPGERLARVGPVALLAAGLACGSAAFAEPPGADAARLFREVIEPTLQRECHGCHAATAAKVRGGLRLDSRAGWLAGGDTGPAVIPGKSGESPLIQALRHRDGLAMPPKRPRLDEPTIAAFVVWVDAGAPDPREPAVAAGSNAGDPMVTPAARRHWAFQAVKAGSPPVVGQSGWVRNPIDAFVRARLEARGLRPAPPATPADWLRRVTFDLTGLPPTPEEAAAFPRDPSEQAYEQVVDRLLASPRYGERWAQHWLDVVRYAETEGYEYDRMVPDAWRYRDYVIDAFNADKPYDRFVTEQLAGDELDPADRDCLTASIFHRLGPVRRNAGNAEIALSRNEVLTERTDILGAAFLGLTIGCARCHNHKLEPISQKDYYRLQAYLAATEEHNITLATDAQRRDWDTRGKAVEARLAALKARARQTTGAAREAINLQIEAVEDELPEPLATIPATRNDPARRTPIHVLRRGVWENKGERVGPRPPTVLVGGDLPELAAEVSDPRTRLARWLFEPGNPLPARVYVNRLWQHHFGTGLVKTVNDFGTRGEPPSHPELLDWLAARLVAEGWRIKPLHRLIVLSAAYRQASRSELATTAERIDPENRLLWRFPRRRLTAEEVRDAMLAVAGRLNSKAGGPGVMLPVDDELMKRLYKPSQWRVTRDPTEHDRRSIYLTAKRNLRLPFFETFDAPPALTSCARRESSTHAPQALELLNGRLSNDLAEAFADRLTREVGGDSSALVTRAFERALGRPPRADERQRAVEFLASQPRREFTLALFNLNEFLYVP